MDSSDDFLSGCCAAVSIVCVLALVAVAVLVALSVAHIH